jgi:glycosyltransferase involved in cell wall biosynthesis
VIATDHGGASEQVIDRTTGLLVPRFAVDEFAGALVELARNDALRAACAMQAREHVRRHFSLDGMIESYARLCVDADSSSRSGENISLTCGARSASSSVKEPVS